MHATPKTTTHNWYNGRRGWLGPERRWPSARQQMWQVIALWLWTFLATCAANGHLAGAQFSPRGVLLVDDIHVDAVALAVRPSGFMQAML